MADDTTHHGTSTTTSTVTSNTVTTDDVPEKKGGGILLPTAAGIAGAVVGGIGSARFVGGEKLREKIWEAGEKYSNAYNDLVAAHEKLWPDPETRKLSFTYLDALITHLDNRNTSATEDALRESQERLTKAEEPLMQYVGKELTAFKREEKTLFSHQKTPGIIEETGGAKGAFSRPWKLLTKGSSKGAKTAVIGGAIALGAIAAGAARVMYGPKESSSRNPIPTASISRAAPNRGLQPRA